MTTHPVLVTDFDGTIAAQDFYLLARDYLTPPDLPDYWAQYLAGELTHFEALDGIFRHIRGDEAEVMAVVRRMDVDPGLHDAVTRLQAAGWEIVVASAGCCWYIERLLAEQQVQITVYANPGHYDPRQGLLMERSVNSPYYAPATGIDKHAIMRDAVQTHATVAFAGDGPPDYTPALQAPPARRFARGWLAERLTAEGVPFRHFARWSEIAAMLLEDGPPC